MKSRAGAQAPKGLQTHFCVFYVKFVSGRILTTLPSNDTAAAWNAGFIRQSGKLRVLLPDESGVPVVLPKCALRFPCRKYVMPAKWLSAKIGRNDDEPTFPHLCGRPSWFGGQRHLA
jgi:hypothetical protein